MATAQATSDPELGFPPKGSLKRFAFPRLMREVARNKLTGSLYLLHGQTKKVVFFEEGQPVFVRSNVLSECLGQILSSEGLITQEQCEQTLEAIRRTGKKQGELLVEMGILSEGNLRYGLEAQLRAKLYDIFSWEDGRYQFKGDPPNLQFGIRLEMCAEGVIIGAIQDQYSEERAALALQPYSDKFLVLRAGLDVTPGQLALLPEEEYFVECLDGSRTVTQCVTEPAAPPVPTPHALVFGLLQAGVAQLGDRALDAKEHGSAPDLGPTPPPDKQLAPEFEAQDVVTEYEDTPLPGELPKVRGLLGDHEAGFDDVGDDDEGPSVRRESTGPQVAAAPAPAAAPEPEAVRPEVSEDLVKAEPERIEETFDADQIGISDEESAALDELEMIEEIDAVEVIDSAPIVEVEAVPESIEPEPIPPPEMIPDAADVPPLEVPTLGDPDIVDPNTEIPIDTAAEDDLNATFADPVLAESEPPPSAGPDALAADNDLLLEADDDLLGADLDGIELDPDADFEDDLDAIDLDVPTEIDPGATVADPVDDDIVDADLVGAELVSGDSNPSPPPMMSPPAKNDDDLISFDDLDAIDLGGDGESKSEGGGDDNAEMVGAMRFNEAETALGAGDHSAAVRLLEEAYENGFDVAELHAMLAYARFCASGEDLETAQHAFELLDYAQNMDPSLDLVHAYRGAIHKALGQTDQAKDALGRALELNPYCELAMQLMDQLG